MFIDFYKDYSWNMLSGFITERSYCLSIASGDKTLTEHIYKVVNLGGNCIKNNDKNYDNGLFSMPLHYKWTVFQSKQLCVSNMTVIHCCYERNFSFDFESLISMCSTPLISYAIEATP